jgi:hypothetical protein
MIRAVLWAATAVWTCALTLGCYNYDPAPDSGPAPGAIVTTSLTDAGALELGHYLGPMVDAVLGRVKRLDADSLVLSVTSVRQRNGIEHFWKGETITLPRSDIAHIDERRLAIGRSVFCVVLGVGGAYELMQAFGVYDQGQESSNSIPTKN